jgi:hypothetical protein
METAGLAADLSAEDIDALTRALRLMRAEGEEQSVRCDALLEERGWVEAATRAAYNAQIKSLGLRPWQAVPFEAADEVDEAGGYGRTAEEVMLKRRMLELGISLYEPNPRAAIKVAEAKLGTVVAARATGGL